MKIVGLDMSLTSTGVAVCDRSGAYSTYLIAPSKGTEGDLTARIGQVQEQLNHLIVTADMIVYEGLVHRSQGAWALAMVQGVFHGILAREDATPDRVVEVPPATLKKWATGKGNASKRAMLTQAVRELDYPGDSDDEADALWLLSIGLELAGYPLMKASAARLALLEGLT